MKTIYHTTFGSHLYGTDTPASDFDFKSVFIPDGRDILLGRGKDIISNKRPKEHGEKNQAGDVDEEAFSLRAFLKLLAEGQTVAIDVLFSLSARSRDDYRIDPIMWEIYDNRHRIITSKSSSFVGYCQKQAAKYGIKGSRVHAVRAVVAFFKGTMEEAGASAKLCDIPELRADFAYMIGFKQLDHTGIVQIEQAPPRQPLDHIICCDRKVPFTASVKTAYDVFKRVLDEYGDRALLAEQNEGVDWKALSHAVRVAREALDILNTGTVTFPLPYAAHLLDIKQGKLQYKDVATEIEDLLESVEAATLSSALPSEADQGFIDNLICRVYKEMVDGVEAGRGILR